MRTRFLNNDYFTQPPSQNHETFPFLHFPVPRLPTPPSSTVHHHLSFDSSLPAPSLQIDPLPIDAALSYFLASVLPHRIHVDSLDLAVSNPDRDASSFAASIECRNRELEAKVTFEDHVNLDIEFHEESKTATPSDGNEVVYVPIQFETPELDTLLENVCFTEKERMQMLSQTPEVENSAEMFNPETSRQYPYEALESVSWVEDPIPEYLKGDNAYSIEDNISVKHQPHPHKIGLIFEADEESLGIPTCLSMVEIVESYFEDIRPQTFDERYQSITESKELLSSVEHDMVKFLLNPQKETVKGNHNFVVESTNDNVNIPKVTSTEMKAGLQLHGWHTVLHRIKLSDNIVAITRYFEKSYRAILQSDTELTRTHKSDVDYFKLLSHQKHKLIEYHVNGNNMAFVVLSAIKQATWYLCFYGLNPACLYVDKLCQNSDYLKSRLGVLQSLIKDENRKMDNNITIAHPSLTMFKEILQSTAKQNSLKALVVAEEVFWWSLKSLLLSLGLSFSELSSSYRNQPYANNLPEDTDAKIKELLSSDCLLVSYKHVSPLFPFNKFGTILEYGGPCGTSKISELSSNSVGLPHLHFLTVDLDDHTVLKALCNGVEIPPDTEMLPESETPLIFNHKGSTVNWKLERLLNFYPVEQSYDIKSSKAAPEADNFALLIPAAKTEHGHKSLEPSPGKLEQLLKFYPVEQSYDIKSSKAAHEADNFVTLIPAMKTEHGQKSLEPSLGSVIIVNTQNVDKEMIVSRRSSYQVILALEKEGIQIVERDLDLPVDIILSSSICLAWYNSRNLGRKSTPATEASSSLPLCIENIATYVLTLLRFYFSGCFLVFEGEFNFLSTVVESSDGLYAAAASLGIDLQIFFSYSPELTNEVTISCIKSVAMLTRGLYPKMTDSVTLAESFLTQFPGINPLTAHSILSSGAMLNEFLAWSYEQRIHVLQKYHVPEESLSLLGVFCKYGEREDSKSIMTDCSSSVSSGPDSERSCFYQADNKRKRKNPVIIDQKDELCFEDLLQFETLNQVVDLGRSIDAGRSRDSTKASLYTNDLFCQNKRNIVTPMRNPSRVSSSSLGTSLTGKRLNWHDLSDFEKLHDDVRGEVVDLTDSPLLDENFISDSIYFPNLMTETKKGQLRENKIARKLSFDNSIHPATNSHSSRLWTSMQDTGGVVEDYGELDFGKDVFPFDFKPRENVGSTQEAKRNLQGLPFQEGITHLSETPLSRARQSSGAFKHSPWTTEFINKVKEKSKLRQKSLLCGNISGPSERRSPSIIDSFRYQPSRRLGNMPEQKRQKQSGQSSNSVKKGRYPQRH